MRVGKQLSARIAKRGSGIAKEFIVAMRQPLGQCFNIVRRTDRGIEHDLMIAQPGKLLSLIQNDILIQAVANNINRMQQLLQRKVFNSLRFLLWFATAAEII